MYRIERQLRDVPGLLARAHEECRKFRSKWEGDERGGRYQLLTPVGYIHGSYTIDPEGRACFDIEKKPALLPVAVIENVLDRFLRGW